MQLAFFCARQESLQPLISSAFAGTSPRPRKSALMVAVQAAKRTENTHMPSFMKTLRGTERGLHSSARASRFRAFCGFGWVQPHPERACVGSSKMTLVDSVPAHQEVVRPEDRAR